MSENKETKKCKHCQTDIPKKAKVCPNCKRKQGGKWKTVLLVILVLGIIVSFMPSTEEETTTKPTVTTNNESIAKEEVVAKEEIIEYMECSVDDMMDILNSNALKAEKEYENKYLVVSGRLGVIDSDGKYISLYPVNDKWAILGIQCYIKNESQLNNVLELSTNDIVTLKVKCTSVGEVMGYSADIIDFVY